MDQANKLEIVESAITQLNDRTDKSFIQLLNLTFKILSKCEFSKYIEAEKDAFETSKGKNYFGDYYNVLIDKLYAERKELSQTNDEIKQN